MSPRIELPALRLERVGEEAYCKAALAVRCNEFWWYFNGLALYQGFSRPFRDETGRWWYRVKPGFAWPVSFLSPLLESPEQAPHWRLLGWQWPVPEEQADSRVRMNVIWQLENYGLRSVATNKRRAIAKGLRSLEIVVASPADTRVAGEACDVWNSHVRRTRWNRPMDVERFAASWAELDSWPGTTIVTARDRRKGLNLCAWMIVRCIGDTLFIDTLASHTNRLSERPNDAIIFATLMAAKHKGLAHAHYSLASKVQSLESFKQSLGFVPHAFPTRLRLRRPVGSVMRLARPQVYERLRGDDAWVGEADSSRGPAETRVTQVSLAVTSFEIGTRGCSETGSVPSKRGRD